VANSPVPRELRWAYDANIPTYPFDQDRAEELLELAGYGRDSNGVRFTIILKVYKDRTRWQQAARFVKEYMEAVGVHIELIELGKVDYWTDVAEGNFELAINDRGMDFCDPDDIFITLYHSEGSWNVGKYHNVLVNEIIEQQREAIDPNLRRTIISQLRAVLAIDLSCLFMIDCYFIVALNRDVKEYKAACNNIYAYI